MLPRVFDLFTQERQALDRAHGGLGLGLTIVRSLVELHDGTIEAHSDGLGKGSEFVIRLPSDVTAQASRPGELEPVGLVRRSPAPGIGFWSSTTTSTRARLIAEALEGRRT